MVARVLVSFIIPFLSDAPVHPNHSPPSALQDIYELKDQIQDVEGRYMQGLKELKVEGLELTACLLLSSGSSMTSLTPARSPLTPLYPPPDSSVVDDTTATSFCVPTLNCTITVLFCMIFCHFLF